MIIWVLSFPILISQDMRLTDYDRFTVPSTGYKALDVASPVLLWEGQEAHL